MVNQLHVFVENRPGRFRDVTGALAKSRINIYSVVIQDRGEFGIMKLLVNDPPKARLALVDRGFACSLKEILAIAIEDKPGGLHALMTKFADRGVNLIDAYGFVAMPGETAVYCTEVADPAETARILSAAGCRLLSDADLYEMVISGS